MSSYRRAEPAYCRGCGARWSSGADACGACGESIEAPPVVGGDPRAVPKLWRALGVVGGGARGPLDRGALPQRERR
jgi:hypothetical protein